MNLQILLNFALEMIYVLIISMPLIMVKKLCFEIILIKSIPMVSVYGGII